MLVNIVIFVFGAMIGSFLNVCIYRLPRDKSIVFPPSQCPDCNSPINFYDNIPILSYLILGGKCRNCKKPIPIRYPLVELTTGLLFILIPTLLGFSISDLGFYFTAAFLCYLIICFFSDLETQIVPDMPSYLIIAAGLSYNYLNGTIISSALGLFWGFGILYLIAFLGKIIYKKDALGGGDIKLASAFGAFLGWERLFVAIFLGYFIGAAVAIILIALKKKTIHDYIPFAPALTTGAAIALFFGWQIINFYIAKLL